MPKSATPGAGPENVLAEMQQELLRLAHEIAAAKHQHPEVDVSGGVDFRTVVGDYERSLIMAALRVAKGRHRKAATLLKLNPSTLYSKMKALGIDVDDFS